MSPKANPTVVGLFIVTGVLLAVAAVFLTSSVQWFTPTQNYILYFDSSLKGLDVGAPLKFRGVTIGSVKQVLIRYNQADDDRHMPVVVEMREDLVGERMAGRLKLNNPAELKRLVGRGLRGVLEAESLVTGVLYVELAMMDDPPPATYHQVQAEYLEIPTAPTQVQALLDNLASMDVAGLSERLGSVLKRLDASLGELQVREINRGLTNLLASLNTIADAGRITRTLDSVDLTLAEFRRTAASLRERLDPLTAQATNALQESQRTLASLRLGVEDLRDTIAPEAQLRHNLNLTLTQMGDAARALAELADFLRRNPNALLTGRAHPAPPP